MTDKMRDRANLNEAQRARVDNAGVLTASGMIAGEALCGLVVAAIVGSRPKQGMFTVMEHAPWFAAIIAFLILAAIFIKVPLANQGHPDEPAPPIAMM